MRSLDDMNTNNMNKHMQQGRRGTTNFILVARAERSGEGALEKGEARTPTHEGACTKTRWLGTRPTGAMNGVAQGSGRAWAKSTAACRFAG